MMKYYMHIGGQQVGPYEETELLGHGLTGSTMVWREGMQAWAPASQVPELRGLLAGNCRQYPQSGYEASRPAMPNTYMVWAILVTVCCCQVFGIISIVKASQVSGLYYQGNYEEALAASRAARNWAIAGAVSSVAIVLACAAINFVPILVEAVYNLAK